MSAARRTLGRTLTVAGMLALATPVVMLDAGVAQAGGRDANRYSAVAQGDAMFYEADSQNAPGSPKNQAGSLTSHVENNSAGNSTSFAGAPYGGPTATTLPGTGSGLIGGLTGQNVPFPFTTLPGYVSSRFPSDPSNTTDMGPFRIKAVSGEFGGSAHAENGGPAQTMAPNQQQTADAKTDVQPDGTVVSFATSSVKGVTVGPITALDAVSSATIRENGNRKPLITSSASGSFSIAGMEVVFDRKGFRVLGTALPAADGLKAVNAALANANIKLTTVPAVTTVNKTSGATTYTIAGLQLTTTQSSPATEPAKIDYLFARSEVTSVSVPEGDTSATKTPVVTQAPAAPPSSGGGLTPGGGGQAPATAPGGSGLTPDVAPAVPDTSDGAAPATGPDTAPPADQGTVDLAGPAPTTLGRVIPQAAALRSESQLLYLVLVLAGLGAFVGSQLFSRYGVLLQLRGKAGVGRAA